MNIYNPKQSGIKGPIVNTLAAAALVISASSMYEGLTKGAIAPIEATNIATITQNKLIDFRNTDFNVTQSGIPDYLSSTFRSQLLGVVEDEA